MLAQYQEDLSFYKNKFIMLQKTQAMLMNNIDKLRQSYLEKGFRDPIEHCKTRIKSIRSVKEKLRRRELPINVNTALSQIYDVIGIRVVCTFINDIYLIRNWLSRLSSIKIINEKNYIKSPKPNGYRSYHIIVEDLLQDEIVYAEIQIRTLAMDCWASLEHQLKYKQEIRFQEMIVDELKRCANELASTDLNLQTIRELIELDSEEFLEV